MTKPDAAGHNRLVALAAEIGAAHAAVEGAEIAKARRALDAGRALIEAKSLLRHGTWLQWLRKNCPIPERSAQLYMKLAHLDLMPEMIAALGFEQAAQHPPPIRCAGLDYPAMLAQHHEEVQRGYLLYALFTGQPDFMDWLLRNGWASPDEWLGEEGDAYRERVGMQPAPERHRAAWQAFKQTWQEPGATHETGRRDLTV